MTIRLHLGVVDLPYAEEGGKSTGDVAEILEAEYHIMQTFAEVHEEDIGAALADSMESALEGLMMGAPPSADPFVSGTSRVDEMFKDFLSNKEMDHLSVPGVPTMAARKGKSHRHKGKKGVKGRPSFIDTGLYQSAFVSWVEQGGEGDA